MKILKIFGIVVGIHVFALILIFANPGCSSSTRPATTPPEAAARAESAPQITAPSIPSGNASLIAAPVNFNPDAPAVAASSGGGFRVAPTRPGTPAANVLVAEPVAAEVTPVTTHVVVAGDNLWNLSKKHGITSAQLAAANNLKTTATLKPGQKLFIPGKTVPVNGATPALAAPTATKAANDAAAKAAPNQLKHTVQPGEVLGNIARRYNVRVQDIATLNNIADPAKIIPGTELLIPEWQTPPNKSGKAAQKSDTTKAGASTKASAQTPPSLPNPERESPPRINEIPVIPVDDSPLTPAPRR